MIGLGFGNFQSVTQVPFSFGNALEFDGVNDYVSSYTLTSNVSTMSFWFYATNGANRRMVSATNASNPTLRLNGGGVVFYVTTLFASVNLNQWNHLVFVSNNGGAAKAYLNGTPTTHNVFFESGNVIGIGAKTGLIYGNYFEGKQDEFAIKENYIISDAEVAELYNSGNGNNFNTVVGSSDVYYQFNQTSPDSTATDSSGNGNTGTLINFDTSTCWVPHTPPFSFGNALRFDGANDYVSLISSVPDVTQQTMSWWSRLYGTAGLGYFFSTADASGANREGLRWDGRIASNYGEVGYFDGGSPLNVITTVGTPTNWNHFQMVRNGTNFQLFLNGVSVYNATITNMSDREIAKFGLLGSNYFMGDMQEIAIWQNVLGDVTSAGLGYNSGNGNLATDMGLGTPNRYYRCNGTSGDSVLVDEGSDLVNGNLLNFDTANCWVAH